MNPDHIFLAFFIAFIIYYLVGIEWMVSNIGYPRDPGEMMLLCWMGIVWPVFGLYQLKALGYGSGHRWRYDHERFRTCKRCGRHEIDTSGYSLDLWEQVGCEQYSLELANIKIKEEEKRKEKARADAKKYREEREKKRQWKEQRKHCEHHGGRK